MGKKSRVLKKDAIPTIFKECEPAECSNFINNNNIEICEKCPNLKIQIENLKKEIMDLTSKHNIEVERLKQTIRQSKENQAKKNVQLNEARKEISKEKNQTERLENVIEQLKAKRLITPEDAILLNVIPFIIYYF